MRGDDVPNRTCDVHGCERPYCALGLCKPHYNRQRIKQGKDKKHRSTPKSELITCEWCGQTAEREARSNRPKPRWCSRQCYGKSIARPPSSTINVIDCAICGDAFTVHGIALVAAKYCSSSCAGTGAYAYAPCPPRTYACELCGANFTRQGRHGRPKYCSDPCYKKSPIYLEAQRARASRRRARMRGAKDVDKFTHLEVFERDGWVCGICGKRVGKSYAHPHPRSATLDHIVPLAGGGTHTLANVQLSHLACNSAKMHTGPGQLRLLG